MQTPKVRTDIKMKVEAAACKWGVCGGLAVSRPPHIAYFIYAKIAHDSCLLGPGVFLGWFSVMPPSQLETVVDVP